ncbi:MAG: hypothetical protein WC843_03305 [Candidatus Gracilibacteria bacterium]|jgi:hypothetical protein
MAPFKKNSAKSSKDSKKEDPKIMATRRIGNTADKEESGVDARALKRLNAKKVIYIEIDDEVTQIYDRLKQLRMKNIYIVAPKRAIIFQSIINLRILKRKAEDLGKNIYIITNDLNGVHLATQIGLTVYDKLEGHEHPSLVSGKFLEDQQNITPLKASINALDDDAPTRQTERKLSISEMIRTGKRKGLAIIAKNLSLKKQKKDAAKKGDDKGKLVLVAPNRQALIALIVVSLIILLTITYIALPGSTLHLTPKSNVLETSVNIILADVDLNQGELDTHPVHEIPSYTITTTIKKAMTYQATGKNFQGQNATGVITVINASNQPWPLIANTRFQTSENLVFRSQKYVTVPAQNGNTPGTIDIPVVADPLDAMNQVIGERGNVGPTKFFLPGLSADNQKKLYAENKTNMTGGKTIVNKQIAKEDLAAAQAKMQADLKASAQVELQSVINKQNNQQKTNLVLLTDSKAIQSGDAKVTIPPNLEGQKLDSFDVQGEITVSGVAYDQTEMMNMLKSELKLKKNPEKRLVHIDDNSLTYRVVDIDAVNKKVKITATIKGIEEFEISPEKENGARLIKKIKEHVVGKDIKEARDYIQNLPEIDKVKVDSWPAWAPTMPSVPDNIRIDVVSGQDS